MDETRSVEKSFDIPKSLIWEAYLKVSGNKGAAGVDGQSLAEFEQNLRNNLSSCGTGCPRGVISRSR